MDNSKNIKEIWKTAVEKLEAEIGADATALWIRPIKPLFIENDILKLEFPDSIIYNTIKDRYEEKLVALILSLTGKNVKIDYSMS